MPTFTTLCATEPGLGLGARPEVDVGPEREGGPGLVPGVELLALLLVLLLLDGDKNPSPSIPPRDQGLTLFPGVTGLRPDPDPLLAEELVGRLVWL